MIPITYKSIWQKAAKLIQEYGQECSSPFQEKAKTELQKAVERYPALREITVEPSLYTVMADNWIEVTLRYVVAPRERRTVKS